MNKIWVLVPLLLAAGAVLADDVPERVEPVTATEARDADADAGSGPDATANGPDDAAKDANHDGPKVISGMSILGNQEAPKSLVIVPWKSSQIGDALGIPTMLDDSVQPVDREVFLRALTYYEIRSETTP